jgi:carbonic anhydrase
MEERTLTRGSFVKGVGGVAGAGLLSLSFLGAAEASASALEESERALPPPKTPADALRVLMRGNRRYRRGRLELRDYSLVGDRIAETQEPFAAIITCADSRLMPPLVFDIGRGNLFVSRIAGNSVDTGTLGSTEYAVAVLGVKIVVVLGHSDCGAVKAAIGVADADASYPADRYGAIGSFVDLVVPAVSALPPAERTLDRSIAANARAQAQKLAASTPIVKPAVDRGDVAVVAGVYDIATGRVSLV